MHLSFQIPPQPLPSFYCKLCTHLTILRRFPYPDRDIKDMFELFILNGIGSRGKVNGQIMDLINGSLQKHCWSAWPHILYSEGSLSSWFSVSPESNCTFTYNMLKKFLFLCQVILSLHFSLSKGLYYFLKYSVFIGEFAF